MASFLPQALPAEVEVAGEEEGHADEEQGGGHGRGDLLPGGLAVGHRAGGVHEQQEEEGLEAVEALEAAESLQGEGENREAERLDERVGEGVGNGQQHKDSFANEK